MSPPRINDRSPERIRTGTLGIIVALLTPLTIALVCVCFFGGESYCFWNPWIDTRTAPQFTEEGFDSLRGGMTTNEVAGILGPPLAHSDASEAIQHWRYTGAGKCRFSDWAWLSREVIFVNGKVVRTEKRIYYD
jgi:hypothetical protein